MARTEVRKECPSCGLGVLLDAKVCEFCGWDFEEEDEWISQIEQLEQELMTEKHRSDDSSMDRMIKSTIRRSTLEKPQESEKAPVVTIKKKATPPDKTQMQVKGPESVKEFHADGKELTEISVRMPPTAPARPRKISVKIGADRGLPPPPEELEEPKPLPPKPTAPAISAKPEVSESGKKVRRVVARQVGEKISPAPAITAPRKATPATAAAPKPIAPAKAAPPAPAAKKAPPSAKPSAPAKPAAPAKAAAPAKPDEEKKGFFGGLGKMFSSEKPAEKPASRPAPSKIPSGKAAPPAAPAKPPTIKVFVCPLCSAEVSEDATTCPKCGAEFA